jgi:hypothetical protein
MRRSACWARISLTRLRRSASYAHACSLTSAMIRTSVYRSRYRQNPPSDKNNGQTINAHRREGRGLREDRFHPGHSRILEWEKYLIPVTEQLRGALANIRSLKGE